MSTAIYFPQPIDLDDEPDPISHEPNSHRSWRGARTVLAAALLLTVGAGLAIIVREWRPGPRDLPTAVAGTAELTTRQFLGESGDRYVVGTAVIDGQRSDDEWTVVVAADLLALTDVGYVVDGVHYYEVRVLAREGTWQVARPPSEVAGPTTSSLATVVLETPVDSPTTAAVQGYLDWLLTGSDGAYHVARPVPAPFVSAIITGLRIRPGPGANSSLATVQVTGLDRFGHALDLSYELTLVHHRGSWIVATDEAP